jgi:hypothetical protein
MAAIDLDWGKQRAQRRFVAHGLCEATEGLPEGSSISSAAPQKRWSGGERGSAEKSGESHLLCFGLGMRYQLL